MVKHAGLLFPRKTPLINEVYIHCSVLNFRSEFSGNRESRGDREDCGYGKQGALSDLKIIVSLGSHETEPRKSTDREENDASDCFGVDFLCDGTRYDWAEDTSNGHTCEIRPNSSTNFVSWRNLCHGSL